MPPTTQLSKAKHTIGEKGIAEFISRSIAFGYRKTVRRVLPTVGYYRKADIPIAERRLLDFLFPGLPFQDDPDHEAATIPQIKEHVKTGDDSLVIGAGSGVTSVIHAKQTTDEGSVVAYEAGVLRAEAARDTIALNDVGSWCDVRTGLVGPAVQIDQYGEPGVSPWISYDDLPECDVLELDCEGAEKDIVNNLPVSPRVIIVEVHPFLNCYPHEIRSALNSQGYTVINKIDSPGMPVLTAVRE